MDIENNIQAEQAKQIEEMKKQVLSKILSKEAYERLSRVRMVDKNLAGQTELYLIQIYQSGKLQGTLNDNQMKDVLSLLSEKKGFNIKRR